MIRIAANGRVLLLVSAMTSLAGCATQIDVGSQAVATNSLGSGDLALPITSMQEARFSGVIRQQYDFSCGSAALATLLQYHYGFKVAEENAFLGMWASGDRAQIRRVGFSLLDMKRWLASRGLAADGYQVDLDKVADAGVPGIALIAIKQYRHFVVVKGVRDHEVLLGDPSLGLTVMPRDEFEAAWNGIYFVVSEDQEMAKRSFNSDRQWAAFNRAPTGGGLSDPVSQQALMLTAPFYGDIS